jgi:6-phosphogluconate dehydrogenase
MADAKYDYGMIGLGTMGRNLVLNLCDHGYSVAGFDLDVKKVESLKSEGEGQKVFGAENMQQFIDSLKTPRTIMLLVPAGDPVDKVVAGLKPLLGRDDLIMDCGNSHYTDTNRRTEQLLKDNIHFMGVGVSGGEFGARFGPSIMPGGAIEAYERIGAMLEAVSAKVNNEPCVTYLGPGSAGHYVKMVHNGIEYALMQLIAETYHLLKEHGGMNNDELHATFSKWNQGILKSFLIEITAEIFAKKDDLTGGALVDMILDSAQQKGTGKWTSQDAMDLGVPIPIIDTALSARYLSADKKERTEGEKKLRGPHFDLTTGKQQLVDLLEQSFFFSMIVSYAQGMTLLYQASKEYGYELKLEEVAKIWRGGCIIRSTLLEDIRTAFSQKADLTSIMLSDNISQELNRAQDSIRKTLKIAVEVGVPMPAMMSSVAYYDSYRRAWMPSNLIQAQRDFFGAHTYARTDREGVFHTQWEQKQ